MQGSDVISILPTGYGKSLIYEILPTIFNQTGDERKIFVLVIVPLNVILAQQLGKLGKESDCLTLPVPKETLRRLPMGEITYLFTHPESIIRKKSCMKFFHQMNIIK